MLATFFLGVLIFIDDYFNCLTVGAVMRPVTDAEKISRAKLSYIIDATAAPICMIAPISSWAAAVSATASDLDTGVTGIQLFIQAIPFNFYSLLTIVFVIGICIMGFDYGPMAKAELAAYRDGNLGSLGNEESRREDNASLIDLLLPIIVLIVCCVIGMLYVGGFWDPEAEGFGDLSWRSATPTPPVGLPWGSIIALVLTFIYLLIRRVVSFKEATECFVSGFKAMVPAMLILTFALTLKLATSALGADVFVHDALEGSAEGLYMMLPAIIFLVALGLAFATGTSWGTFGILIPIVVAVFDPTPDAADHRHLRLPGWRGLRRPHLADFRHDGHGVSGREREPYRARVDADSLRAHRGRHLVRVLHHRRLRAECIHLPRHRPGAGHRHAHRAAQHHRQEASSCRRDGPSACREARMLIVAACALARDDARQVVRAEADERRALFLQGGQHDFAPLAIGQDFARLRVDDLRDVRISAPNTCMP